MLSVKSFNIFRKPSLNAYNASWCRFLSSQSVFEKAQENLKKLVEEPSVDVKLQLYGLFKQATLGDATGKRPGALDFAGRAKFDAWKTLSGTSKEIAQKQYSELVATLLPKHEEKKEENIIDGLKSVPGLNVSIEGKVFKIQFNRPEKFNAITWEMYEGLIEALDFASKDRLTTVTVITGTGDYYCSGNDLSNFTRIKSVDEIPEMAAKGAKVLDRYTTTYINHEKPLIALINGPAIGISVTLLALFDLVLASDKATFHTPFTILGQSPEGCSSYTYPLLMGHLKASEMLLFGRKLTALEAMERNLVNDVLPANQFEKECERRIAEYANFPPESFRLNKLLLRDVHRENLLKTKGYEIDLLENRWKSKECMDALNKFMSRKK